MKYLFSSLNFSSTSILWSLLFLALSFLLSSCSTSRDAFTQAVIQKRKFRKGFHVDIGQGKRKASETQIRIESDEPSTLAFGQPITASMVQDQSSADQEEVMIEGASYYRDSMSTTVEGVLTAEKELDEALIEQSDHQQRMKKLMSVSKQAKVKRHKKRAFVTNRFVRSSRDFSTTKTHWAGITGLSCGLFGLIISGVLFGLAAIIFSTIALSAQNKNPEAYDSKGFALAGLFLGLFNVVFVIALVLA